jgi:hypothetical protein
LQSLQALDFPATPTIPPSDSCDGPLVFGLSSKDGFRLRGYNPLEYGSVGTSKSYRFILAVGLAHGSEIRAAQSYRQLGCIFASSRARVHDDVRAEDEIILSQYNRITKC